MCLNPIYLNYSIVGNKYNLDWSSSGTNSLYRPSIGLPCGNCPECWNAQSTEWAVRCCLEAQEHKQNCVITLTYSEDYYPERGELNKRHYQLFLKRLRKAIAPTRIKYFISGEYGDKRGRPHYHLQIFGWCPGDLRFSHKSKRGTSLYQSQQITELWGMGLVVVDPNVTFESSFYSAKYMQKALSIIGDYHDQPPFVAMSKGIAERKALEYDPLKQTAVYVRGKRYKIPRYFKKVAEKNGKALPLRVKLWIRPVYKFDDLLNLPLHLLKNSQLRISRDEKLSSNQVKWQQFYDKLKISAREYWQRFNIYAKIRRRLKLQKKLDRGELLWKIKTKVQQTKMNVLESISTMCTPLVKQLDMWSLQKT